MEKRKEDDAKTTALIDKLNKRIKKIKKGPRTIKTRPIVNTAGDNFKKSLKMKKKNIKNI